MGLFIAQPEAAIGAIFLFAMGTYNFIRPHFILVFTI